MLVLVAMLELVRRLGPQHDQLGASKGVDVVDSETFAPVNLLSDSGKKIRILIACKFGNARLIDNIGVVIP